MPLPGERLRRRRVVESRTHGSPRMRVEGRELLAFCSNDYLGLADHPKVIEALVTAAREWGVGSGASHLVSGHCSEHHALEDEIAAFVGRPRALLFSTGYMANLAVVATLLERGDRVFEDRHNHASLLDAGLASGARFSRYPHGDVAVLRSRLARGAGSQAMVVTDGVFSMDGDVAPLRELASACRERDAWLFVDDAHGFGVLGPGGRGSVEAAGLGVQDVPVLMGTLGKACGTFGAFVAGSNDLVETLLQHARTYIYTTALPPAVAAAARASLRLLQEEPWRRSRVLDHVARFRREASRLGLPLMDSGTPIQPLLLGTEAAALAASDALLAAGIWVPAIRPPTVPAGTSRLRVMLHGWALHGGIWGPWLDGLALQARLHVVDLPGHGRSEWPAGVHDLEGLARAVSPHVPADAAWLGWSLGGLVALELARQQPGRARALVLVATTPRFLAGPDWEHGLQPEILDTFTQGLAGDYRATVQNFLALQTRGDERAREALRLLRSQLASHGEPDPRALRTGLEILRNTDLRDALPRIAAPALVVAGEHDRLTPASAGRELAAALPAARFELIERSGHAPFLSHPGEMLAVVTGFLARHAGVAAA